MYREFSNDTSLEISFWPSLSSENKSLNNVLMITFFFCHEKSFQYLGLWVLNASQQYSCYQMVGRGNIMTVSFISGGNLLQVTNKLLSHKLWKFSLNSDGPKSYQYQQNEQLPLISNHWTQKDHNKWYRVHLTMIRNQTHNFNSS